MTIPCPTISRTAPEAFVVQHEFWDWARRAPRPGELEEPQPPPADQLLRDTPHRTNSEIPSIASSSSSPPCPLLLAPRTFPLIRTPQVSLRDIVASGSGRPGGLEKHSQEPGPIILEKDTDVDILEGKPDVDPHISTRRGSLKNRGNCLSVPILSPTGRPVTDRLVVPASPCLASAAIADQLGLADDGMDGVADRSGVEEGHGDGEVGRDMHVEEASFVWVLFILVPFLVIISGLLGLWSRFGWDVFETMIGVLGVIGLINGLNMILY